MNNWCIVGFHGYINEMHGSRSKIPSKNLFRQRCAEGFNYCFKGLIRRLMRNVQICGKFKVCFVLNNFFPENCAVY
jgi:hypothetical protein